MFQFARHDYLREEGEQVHGPADFGWDERQLGDLTTLFHGEDADGARMRLSRDLAEFLAALRWLPSPEALEAADDKGEEFIFTVMSDALELYTLPWEITRASADEMMLVDHPSVLVRHALPGLPAREAQGEPEHPGVLFCWSDAEGRVPQVAMGATLSAACEKAGVGFQELPRFHAA